MQETISHPAALMVSPAYAQFSSPPIIGDPTHTPPVVSHELRIAFAQTEQDMEAVYQLTHDRYVDMGYCLPRGDHKLIHYPHLDGISETYVLLLWQAEKLMGTVSLTLDGSMGLHVDEDFKPQVDAVRKSAGRLASSWRIVTRADSNGQRTVMTLLKSVVCLAFKVLECETFLCTFHPRHERVYSKLLKMETIKTQASSKSLLCAPSVLMRCDANRCPQRWFRGPELPVLKPFH